MAVDWEAMPNHTGLTGTIERRVENDGLVRFQGIGTATALGSGIRLLTYPPLESPIYFDWKAGGKSILWVNDSYLYAANNGPVPMAIDFSAFTYKVAPLPVPVMAHTLANVRIGIANALKTLAGLRVYDFPSDRIEPPAAVLSMPETPYDVTLDGRNDEWTFPLWVLVAKADDKSAYGEMGEYLEAEGTRSIRAAIEADRSLGGACDSAAVVRARPLFATVAGTEFLAVEFTLEVYT